MKTWANFDELEIKLKISTWVAGDRQSSEDAKAFAAIKEVPDPDSHPHTFAWWSITSRYTQEIRNSWKAPACGASTKEYVEPKAKGKEGKKKQTQNKDDSDDGFDPFADEW